MTWDDDLIEIFRIYLPKYLSPDLLEDLSKGIRDDFPNSTDSAKVYSEIPDSGHFFQGDAIEDVPFSVFSPKTVDHGTDFRTGILISNTCDVSTENSRTMLPFAVFGMVYSLDEYIERLKGNGISKDKIDSFLNSLRSNRITNLMYLPSLHRNGETIVGESFLRFDRLANIPAAFVEGKYGKDYFPNGNRLFSLSSYGFFLFITKLSVHFCRFRENVIRSGF